MSKTDEKGFEAERNVFTGIKAAAEKICRKNVNLQFLLFHSVKYGTTGEGPAARWESDIDAVLLCYDRSSG